LTSHDTSVSIIYYRICTSSFLENERLLYQKMYLTNFIHVLNRDGILHNTDKLGMSQLYQRTKYKEQIETGLDCVEHASRPYHSWIKYRGDPHYSRKINTSTQTFWSYSCKFQMCIPELRNVLFILNDKSATFKYALNIHVNNISVTWKDKRFSLIFFLVSKEANSRPSKSTFTM